MPLLADGEGMPSYFSPLATEVLSVHSTAGVVDLARDGVGRERDGLFVVEGRLRDHVHKDKRVVVYAEIIQPACGSARRARRFRSEVAWLRVL